MSCCPLLLSLLSIFPSFNLLFFRPSLLPTDRPPDSPTSRQTDLLFFQSSLLPTSLAFQLSLSIFPLPVLSGLNSVIDLLVRSHRFAIMPKMLLPSAAVLLIYYFFTVLHTPGTAAELAFSQLPLWAGAGPRAQSLASVVSSEYSTSLGCPKTNAAACLCSLGLVSLFADATAAAACCSNICQGATSTHTATDYARPYAGQNLISFDCQVNGFTTPTVAPNPATLGMFVIWDIDPITRQDTLTDRRLDSGCNEIIPAIY